MEVIPAIDVKGGKCVRLYQGDRDRVTVYANDPGRVALNWKTLGGTRMHVVDLDGAAQGSIQNIEAIKRVVRNAQVPVQVGGGIRRMDTIRQLIGMGVQRVILGTAAVTSQVFLEEAIGKHKDAVVIAVDVMDGLVATHGWLETSQVTPSELIKKCAALGAKRFIYTDISRDGTMTEPNFDAIIELVKQTSLPIIASGGISSIAHLERLAQSGVEAAIVGQALYNGSIDLRDALKVAGQ